MVSFGWGMAVTLGIYAAGSISGAHLNPAVSVGLAISGDLAWSEVGGYVLFQLMGGILGGVLVWLQYLPHWAKTEDQGIKLGVFSTSPALPSKYSNLLSETMGAFALVFAIMFIGANKFTEGLNPMAVGALVFAIGMSMGGSTGYAINPARDLGPRIAHFLLPIAGKGDSNWSYSWIPIVGPILGGALGSVLYDVLFNQRVTYVFCGIAPIIIILIAAALVEQNKNSNE